jgi:hypothetical protein
MGWDVVAADASSIMWTLFLSLSLTHSLGSNKLEFPLVNYSSHSLCLEVQSRVLSRNGGDWNSILFFCFDFSAAGREWHGCRYRC